jgi:hypothetical protein
VTPSNAKVPLVDMRHATGAKAIDVVSAEASDATNAQTTHVTSAKAAHTATKVSAALGLGTRGKQTAGKRCACQNHHHSSSHDMFHLNGRIVPPQDIVRRWRVQHSGRRRRDTMEMRTLSCFLN